jgi:hypothetical protein
MTETKMLSLIIMTVYGLFFIHRITKGIYQGKLKITIGNILEISSDGKS